MSKYRLDYQRAYADLSEADQAMVNTLIERLYDSEAEAMKHGKDPVKPAKPTRHYESYITSAEAVVLYPHALAGEGQRAMEICRQLEKKFKADGEDLEFLDYAWCCFHAGVIAGKRAARLEKYLHDRKEK